MISQPKAEESAPSSGRAAGQDRDAPSVTVAIITRNRKDELRDAVKSALAQEGCRIEVLVLDDGSRDGTGAMLRHEFPGVRVVRYDDDADVAARRNDAAALATGDVLVSIDDDAVFSSPRIVADTLRDLEHPRIAAVAIPYIDVGVNPRVQQLAPDALECWVTTIFRATAYAVRCDVFREIGGYTPEIQQFGEERDLSLKLLNAGYLIRLGRSDPIHHRTSAKRDYRRMEIYFRRNELLICWLYFPFPWNLLFMVIYPLKGLRSGIRVGRTWYMIEGIVSGVRTCLAARGRRRPISRRAFRFDRRSRARARVNAGVRLEEAEIELGPAGPAPKPPDGGWPGPARRLYRPLRRARAQFVRAVGRPVRCEVCGQVLFHGLPFIWRGRLKLLGAESVLVRADWDKMNRLTFRHVEQDRCDPS